MKKPLEVLQLYPVHDYTLHGALASRERRDPRRPFMLLSDKKWSWREFASAVDRTACLLIARGIKRGDRVAVMARNSDGHVLLLFALARIGAIMVPVNPEFGVNETGYVLNHAEVSAVACSTDTLAVAREACGKLKPWFMLLDGAAADAPNLFDLVAQAPPVALPDDVKAEDTCLIVYTSGTTGFPKGAMHSQRSFVTSGEAFVQRIYLQDDDRVMIVLPLFHINALFYSVAGTLVAGCSMAIVPKFSASSFWQTAVDVQATEVNIIEAVGTILQNRPRSEFRPEHKLRRVYGIRQQVADTFRGEFGIPHLIGGFGMTEIPGVICNPFEGPQKPGSMGPISRHPDPARPWAECRVVDDEGRDVGVGAVGELIVKTPIIMQGYYRDPGQTRAAFRDGWFFTGDLVRRDADGYFYFVSRKKDIIRRRGENIAGAELDRVIGSHPDVHEAAAIPVPAELGEDDILAAVVLKAGATLTAQDIAQWCRERLAPMKVPRFVVFADELPHTPTHKVAKTVLRADPTLKARAVDLETVNGER
ncbi:MAG: long-chain fatty acid--CoA ligase [Betaproteobacteria bacterium RIFCSPLOWO2_12_FULL_62_58]|nr:MAG: long-chain fatty acid--CoA ligase [Betaproteobacteria bacterium RIFCSPLOWO2_12_FULL_62_58]